MFLRVTSMMYRNNNFKNIKRFPRESPANVRNVIIVQPKVWLQQENGIFLLSLWKSYFVMRAAGSCLHCYVHHHHPWRQVIKTRGQLLSLQHVLQSVTCKIDVYFPVVLSALLCLSTSPLSGWFVSVLSVFFYLQVWCCDRVCKCDLFYHLTTSLNSLWFDCEPVSFLCSGLQKQRVVETKAFSGPLMS